MKKGENNVDPGSFSEPEMMSRRQTCSLLLKAEKDNFPLRCKSMSSAKGRRVGRKKKIRENRTRSRSGSSHNKESSCESLSLSPTIHPAQQVPTLFSNVYMHMT